MKFLHLRILVILIALSLVFRQQVTAQALIIPLNDDYVAASDYPFVNMSPGDTVWLQSGTRGFLKIANFHGLPGKPIVFANLNGQVIFDTDHNYGLVFSNCSFFKLTGISGSFGKYGIYIRRVNNPDGFGIAAGEKCTDLEIENCEVAHVGFAGIQARTEPECDDISTWRGAFTQYNTLIHDCYVHHVGGEGLYIGYTSYDSVYLSPCKKKVLGPVLVGTRIYNNRIDSTGYDGIQVSSATSDCEIHHNTLTDCSYRMVTSQMSGIMIGGGTQAKCYNNKIIDPYTTGIVVLGKGGTKIFNNLIIRPAKRYYPDSVALREYGIYVADKTFDDQSYDGIFNNTIIQPKSDGIRIVNSVHFPVRIFNNSVIDPGAFDVYEHDNTDREGKDSYVYDDGHFGNIVASNNYFGRSLDTARFVNVAGNNFRLQLISPMVNSGKSLIDEGVIMDLDDRARPVAGVFDVGAYEYSPSQTVGYVEEVADFTLGSLTVDPSRQLIVNVVGSRGMKVNLSLIDRLGRVIYQQQGLEISMGNNKLTLPANNSGLVILTIQSDRLKYARKIILL